MSVMDVIKSRRSVRSYLNKPVPREKLVDLIEAARWAPTAGNIQPWYFGVIDDPEVVEKINDFSPGLMGGPTSMLVICRDLQEAYRKAAEAGRDVLSLMDISMAAQNVMLRAEEMKLATCCVKSFNQRAVNKILKLPEHVVAELIISVGYPDRMPKNPPRKQVKKITFYNGWSDQDE